MIHQGPDCIAEDPGVFSLRVASLRKMILQARGELQDVLPGLSGQIRVNPPESLPPVFRAQPDDLALRKRALPLPRLRPGDRHRWPGF